MQLVTKISPWLAIQRYLSICSNIEWPLPVWWFEVGFYLTIGTISHNRSKSQYHLWYTIVIVLLIQMNSQILSDILSPIIIVASPHLLKHIITNFSAQNNFCYSCQQIIEVDRRVSLPLFCMKLLVLGKSCLVFLADQ